MPTFRSSLWRARGWLRAGSVLLAVMTTQNALAATSPALDLYVDSATNPVYTEPGPNRVLLGRFVPAEEGAARNAVSPPVFVFLASRVSRTTRGVSIGLDVTADECNRHQRSRTHHAADRRGYRLENRIRGSAGG